MAPRLLFAGLLASLLVACGGDHQEMHRCKKGGTRASTCEFSVGLVAEGLTRTYRDRLPLSVKACFDQSCDDMRLELVDGRVACRGLLGGPLDQLTSCDLPGDDLEVVIERVDGQRYDDGREHTVALSVLASDGDVLLSHAAAVAASQQSCSPVWLSVLAEPVAEISAGAGGRPASSGAAGGAGFAGRAAAGEAAAGAAQAGASQGGGAQGGATAGGGQAGSAGQGP